MTTGMSSYNKIAVYSYKFQMSCEQGSLWLIEGTVIFHLFITCLQKITWVLFLNIFALLASTHSSLILIHSFMVL